jgi:hypothetical protein
MKIHFVSFRLFSTPRIQNASVQFAKPQLPRHPHSAILAWCWAAVAAEDAHAGQLQDPSATQILVGSLITAMALILFLLWVRTRLLDAWRKADRALDFRTADGGTIARQSKALQRAASEVTPQLLGSLQWLPPMLPPVAGRDHCQPLLQALAEMDPKLKVARDLAIATARSLRFETCARNPYPAGSRENAVWTSTFVRERINMLQSAFEGEAA